VRMPTLRRKLPSVAPVLMAGITGIPGRSHLLDRSENFGAERRRRALIVDPRGLDRNLLVVDNTRQRLLHVVDGFARQHAAVHRSLRALRQGIIGMAAGQQRSNAGGAQFRIVSRLGGQTSDGGRIGIRRGDR